MNDFRGKGSLQLINIVLKIKDYCSFRNYYRELQGPWQLAQKNFSPPTPTKINQKIVLRDLIVPNLYLQLFKMKWKINKQLVFLDYGNYT